MSGGISTYAPCAPVNARLKASVSRTSAANASAPRLTNGASLLLSRPTTRTFLPLSSNFLATTDPGNCSTRARKSAWSSNFLATTDPVFPLAPKMTYMISSYHCMKTMQFEAGKTPRGITITPGSRPALLHRHLDALFLGEQNCFGIPRIYVPHDAHSRIVCQHALDALRHFF